MAVQVEFDARVQEKTGGAGGAAVTATTVREALYQVSAAHPSLRMFNCEGELRSVFHVRRGGADAALEAPVGDGDMLMLGLV